MVERTIAHLHQNRRLKVRYERRADIHPGFLTLAGIRLCCSGCAGSVWVSYAYPVLDGNRVFVKDKDAVTPWAVE